MIDAGQNGEEERARVRDRHGALVEFGQPGSHQPADIDRPRTEHRGNFGQ
ncbi:hypothetical protein QP179_16555 [Sphingomonas aurantiaca]